MWLKGDLLVVLLDEEDVRGPLLGVEVKLEGRTRLQIIGVVVKLQVLGTHHHVQRDPRRRSS